MWFSLQCGKCGIIYFTPNNRVCSGLQLQKSCWRDHSINTCSINYINNRKTIKYSFRPLPYNLKRQEKKMTNRHQMNTLFKGLYSIPYFCMGLGLKSWQFCVWFLLRLMYFGINNLSGLFEQLDYSQILEQPTSCTGTFKNIYILFIHGVDKIE